MKKLLSVLALAVVFVPLAAADFGKIIVVGDIHEYLTRETAEKIVSAAGKSGLILLPGDLLHRPYSKDKYNPKIILDSQDRAKHPQLAGRGLSTLTPNELNTFDETVVGWFRNAPGADRLAGIAVVLGNHEFHRGEKQAVETLKKLHKTSSKIKVLNNQWYDFYVNGHCIRVIGYPAWQQRYRKGTNKEETFADFSPLKPKFIENIVKFAGARPPDGKSGAAHPHAIIIMTHQSDKTDMKLAKTLENHHFPCPLAIVGGHSHSRITFVSDNGQYSLKQVVLDEESGKTTTYDPVRDHKKKKLYFSIPILKTGWHNQARDPYYSIGFPADKGVMWFGPGHPGK